MLLIINTQNANVYIHNFISKQIHYANTQLNKSMFLFYNRIQYVQLYNLYSIQQSNTNTTLFYL